MLMHLQSTVDYEHFARALSIGPETMVMDFRPDQPMHNRYAVSHGFLSESAGRAGGRDQPRSSTRSSSGSSTAPRCWSQATRSTRSTTRTPVRTWRSTSLHYYFPWAMTALVRWSTYCVVTGRSGAGGPADGLGTSRSPTTPTAATTRSSMATWRWPTSTSRPSATGSGARRTCRTCEEQVHDWVSSADFDSLLRDTRPGVVPAARAGAVPGALPGPDRPLAGRPERTVTAPEAAPDAAEPPQTRRRGLRGLSRSPCDYRRMARRIALLSAEPAGPVRNHADGSDGDQDCGDGALCANT